MVSSRIFQPSASDQLSMYCISIFIQVSKSRVSRPATAGLPVAYGVCEALRAKQVYWAEEPDEGGPLRFRQYLEQHPGEQVVLVDDILRSGRKLAQMKSLLESRGASVVGVAVVIYQPTPRTYDFGSLPLYYLARLEASYYTDAGKCELCKSGVPLEKVWV